MAVPGAVTDPARVAGEEIIVETGGGAMTCYLARPTGAPPRAGLVIIHDAYGLSPHTRDVAERFANLGYAALAPDLYHRVGAPRPDDPNDLMARMLGLSDAGAVADLDDAARHLGALPGVEARIGCIGFCAGGRHTLLWACSSRLVTAAMPCWGGFVDRATPGDETTPARPTPVLDLVGGLSCPLLVAGGAEDVNPSPAVLGQLVERLGAHGRTGAVKIYGGAGHAFLNDARPALYREGPAHELFADAVSFFGRHLAG